MTAVEGCFPATGSPAAAADPHVRMAVFYDGFWYQNVVRFFACTRGATMSVAGLHDTLRWYTAGLFGSAAGQVAITHAHYVAGRVPDAVPDGWEQELADHGIARHDVPVTAAKGEIGADVELALTCHQIACDTSPDMIVLLAGDGDFAPLAARLAGRGLRVLVPPANFSYSVGRRTIKVTTARLLSRCATDTPSLTDLVDSAMTPDYPPHLRRPLTLSQPAISPPRVACYNGTITSWDPDALFGFISADGQTWYASAWETPGQEPLPPGTEVMFTGHPDPAPGTNYPAARAITPQVLSG